MPKTLFSGETRGRRNASAAGAGNYIIGSLPAHKRFFLWLTGIQGEREASRIVSSRRPAQRVTL